ncbi:glycosyltransferase family 2 protein [Limosilactobacillus reuteri]|uniref:glycosyltransferase family 2 protein n=1 Tax=Limosilactobacillus reuteri TaxID=1598 RepID=UPI0005139028|nr:glycosyltransferase [Limosilactobacillus reuteri]KGE72383.1 glycosyl transferase [Limosilactobacillus reuteri]
MLLSVIIPAYNCEKTIIRAIRSTGVYLSNQIEVIVVNNGSTDNTETLIKKEAKNNKNIIYVESEKGVSNARNKGIEMVTAEWITFLDADDYLINLENNNIFKELLNCSEDLIICNYFVNSSKINLYSMTDNRNDKIKVVKQMLENPTKYLTVWGNFYRTDLVKKENIRFDNKLLYSEDSEFLLNYLLVCNRLVFINCYVYKYVLSENSTVRKYNPQLAQEYEKAICKIKKDLIEYPEFENSLSIFVLMQINLIMVHNIFLSKNAFIELKKICNKNYIQEALSKISLKNILTPRLLPLVFCKYHCYICAGIIYKLRVIQNRHK